MNLRKILTPVVIGLFLLCMAADARYVYLLPPAGSPSPTLTVFNEQMQQVGAVPVPAGATQVLTNSTGDKAIVIAQNSTAAVSFITIQNGQVTGNIRSLNLDNLPANAAAMTPDGQRLLVLAGASPGTLFMIDAGTEAVQTGGKITIGSTPRDLVVTQDSRYAAILSTPGLLTVIDLSNNQVVTQTGIAGLAGIANISLSPSGSIFVTGQYLLIEFEGRPPFSERARSSVFTFPGKLIFSADGRYAITTNELLSGSSLLSFDLEVRGSPTSTTAAGTQISFIPITLPGNPNALKVDKIIPITDKLAVAHVSSAGRVFLVNYPVLSASDLSLGASGVPQNVSGLTASNEFPTVRTLFYDAAGQIYKHDLLNNAAQGSALATQGNLSFTAAPSTAAPAQIFGYGANQTVGPNVQMRPYFIRIVDANGRPVYAAAVQFTPETAGVTLTSAATATNVDGYAWVTATSPATNGAFTVRATVGSATIQLASTVTGGSGGGGGGGGGGGDTNVARMIKVSGDGQLIQLGFAVDNKPLVVRVVDAAGKPIANKQVMWTETGGISFSGPTTVQTDEKGEALINIIPGGSFGPGIPYLTYTVTAASDVGNVSFTVTSYPFTTGGFNPAPTIQMEKPTQDNRNLTLKLGTKTDDAIRVIVVTTGGIGVSPGLPIPGVGLDVTTGNTDPAVGPVARCEGGTVLTGENGTASCNLIVEGKTGTAQLSVNVGNLRIFQDLRLTVTPGDPVAPVIVDGNNQTGKPGATLPKQLVARIVDPSGNILAGTAVTWEVVTANSVRLFNTISTADMNGLVSTAVQLGSNPGKFQVKVKAGARESIFETTIETLATGFAKVSGDGQPATPINTAFPQPLVVVVTDAQGVPVPNATVSWTVSGPATLSATSTPTGANGRAQVNVTAGSVPGNITVTATVPNLPALSFALQSRLPGPSITTASFTNWASGQAGVSPGNLVLITGPGLAPNVRGEVNADLLAGHLPYELSGVTVEFRSGGRSDFAPIYRVSNENGVESVLIQAPFELATGTVNAIVSVGGGNTTVSGITVQLVSPGVIEDVIAGRRAAVVIRSDGLTVTPSTPARRGEVVRMYAIGLGQTTPLAETNRIGQPDQNVQAAVAVGVDNQGVTVIRAQLAENLVGVYEIVFQIPEDATIGPDRPLGFVMEAVPGVQSYANGSLISIGPAGQ